MTSKLRTAAIGWLGFAASWAAFAQAGPSIENAPSPVRCADQPPAAELAYPRGAGSRRSGVVRVRMQFADARAAPDVQVFFDSLGAPFDQLVRQHARQTRLPCLEAGETVLAVQEFQFVGGTDPVVMRSPLRVAADVMSLCLHGANAQPRYPMLSRSAGEQGTVIARYTFEAKDAPPKVDILFDAGRPRLAEAVRDHAAGLRLGCAEPIRLPLTANQMFTFRLTEKPARVLRDMSLTELLAVTDNLPTRPEDRVRFDLDSMGCPFDLRLTLRQPFLDNLVEESASAAADPNRRELVEWLRKVRLRADQRVLNQIVGGMASVHVPCGTVSLP